MKKNKKWLKEELSKQIDILHTTISSGNYVSSVKRAEIMNLIDQLEEPEQEKVVVPQWLGKWMDSEHITTIGLAGSFYRIGGGEFSSSLTHDQNCYIEAHAVDMLRGIGLGYEVETEKLYKVLLPGVESIDRQMCMHEETKVISFTDDGYNSRKYSKDDEFIRLFTEREIKAIDERYWQFAEEVTK